MKGSLLPWMGFLVCLNAEASLAANYVSLTAQPDGGLHAGQSALIGVREVSWPGDSSQRLAYRAFFDGREVGIEPVSANFYAYFTPPLEAGSHCFRVRVYLENVREVELNNARLGEVRASITELQVLMDREQDAETYAKLRARMGFLRASEEALLRQIDRGRTLVEDKKLELSI